MGGRAPSTCDVCLGRLSDACAVADDCHADHHEAAAGGARCALAAGLALPLLALLGYTPGTRSEAGLQTLSLAYAVLPCLLKLAAAAALYLLVVRRTPGSAAFQAP